MLAARSRVRLPGIRVPRAAARDGRGGRRRDRARGRLVAEAGTGTGKTFAYLVPALLDGGKVIVSTGTKTLQDQLYERDLPLVRDALRLPVTRRRCSRAAPTTSVIIISSARREGRSPRRETAGDLPKIVRSRAQTRAGDQAELADVPENAPIWPLSRRRATTASAAKCPLLQRVLRDEGAQGRARRRRRRRQPPPVLRRRRCCATKGIAELLPACNTVILDEAHQLPDTATLFFGEQTTAGQLAELARDARSSRAPG